MDTSAEYPGEQDPMSQALQPGTSVQHSRSSPGPSSSQEEQEAQSASVNQFPLMKVPVTAFGFGLNNSFLPLLFSSFHTWGFIKHPSQSGRDGERQVRVRFFAFHVQKS